MRKRQISPKRNTVAFSAEGWRDIEGTAVVEITSEDTDHPVESALGLGEAGGWRAAEPAARKLSGWFSMSRRGSSV